MSNWQTFLALFGKILRKPRQDFKPDYILVGLGNPGEQYCSTRHNIGFRVIDRLGVSLNKKSVQRRCESQCMSGDLDPGQQSVALVKPLTFMNRSGVALKACLEEFGVSLGNCLVIVDDFNIPLGTIRFRKGGTHGGHNGLRSIISSVGSEAFPRLRVGIGPLPKGLNVIDFVLGSFTDKEISKVDEVIEATAQAVGFMLEEGIDNAMNRYNSVPLKGANGE